MIRSRKIFVFFLLVILSKVAIADPFTGTVLSSGNRKSDPDKEEKVVDAKVYLISTQLISKKKITSQNLRRNSSFDEPLEDIVKDSPANLLPPAITDSNGNFNFESVPKGNYYIFVMPSKDDNDHLPGGDRSRTAYSAEEQLRGANFKIALSSGKFQKDYEFRGSRSCVDCHKKLDGWDKNGKHWKKTAHKLGWSMPGKKGIDQDFSNFPTWFESLESWPVVEKDNIKPISKNDCSKNPQVTRTGNGPYPKDPKARPTHLEIGDYNLKKINPFKESTAGFKLRVACDEGVPISKVYADIFLWKEEGEDEKYIITISNRLNSTHKNAMVHLPVKLIYGGGVHRQRFVVSVPNNLQQTHGSRKGHYSILQYNIDGDDNRLNENRRQWRDYKISYWWSAGDDKKAGTDDDFIRAPDINKNTIEAECAGCHVTGAQRISDNPDWSGQVQIKGIMPDENGAFDIDQDGHLEEVNVGCESCHGPGSEHNKAARGDPKEMGITKIINPKLLSAERSDLICGRCHDRRKAKFSNAATQAVNKKNEFFPAGQSREEIISEYSAEDEAGPLDKHLWPDKVHSSSPRQQYSENMKSLHYKNDRILVSCADCHNGHGTEKKLPSLLREDSENPYSPLCLTCHENVKPTQHLFEVGHPRMESSLISCISCHMVGTSRPGGDSGQQGLYATHPPFKTMKDERKAVYWEGNLNSHVFDVPKRISCGVWGEEPGDAMPIPYTNSCGSCHRVYPLRSQDSGDVCSPRK